MSKWASLISGKADDSLVLQARKYLESTQSLPSASTLSDGSRFGILIGFHSHLEYFRECIESVVRAVNITAETYVELIVVNDDPSVDSIILKEILDHTSLPHLVRTNKANLGICRSINEAIPHIQSEWVLHLDCDDLLEREAISTLQTHIRNYPGVRFISSRVIDITESGAIMAYRLRDETPVDLIENNYASHLKAIRKDLHEEIGFFNPLFEGCQDFEFALRTALFERLLFVPEYLYRYRWHDFSQTVGNSDRQNETILRIRQTYLLAIDWILHGVCGVSVFFKGPHSEIWTSKVLISDSTKAKDPLIKITVHISTPFSQAKLKLLIVRLAAEAISACYKNATSDPVEISFA
jgi:glycosyltransferase involved in cell wall biosynthesis